MGNPPEVIRLRVPSPGEDAREFAAWRIGPALFLTATSRLPGCLPRRSRRLLLREPGQPEQVLLEISHEETNLTLLAPALEGHVAAPDEEGAPLALEVLGGAEGSREEAWALLADLPGGAANCMVLLPGGARVRARFVPQGACLEVTLHPEASVEPEALLGCPVVRGGRVVGLVTQRTRSEGVVRAATAPEVLALWRRRCQGGPYGWRQRSFVYGTFKLFLAAIADFPAWRRELAQVDPRLSPGFGVYQLSPAQLRDASLLSFLLRSLLGPAVTVLLFDLALLGLFLRNPTLMNPMVRDALPAEVAMSYGIAMVGALGLSLLTGVGAAASAATLGGMVGGVTLLLVVDVEGWLAGGITAGTMCGTACGLLWNQRRAERTSSAAASWREQLLAVLLGLLESLALLVPLALVGVEFANSGMVLGRERERILGSVLGLLLTFPSLLAFFLRRREVPGKWFPTVLLGMGAAFASLGAILLPLLEPKSPSVAYGLGVGVLVGVALCGVFSLVQAAAENFGAGAWSGLAPLLGVCLIPSLVLLFFAALEGQRSRIALALLGSSLMSFALMGLNPWLRQWTLERARRKAGGEAVVAPQG